MKKGDKICQNIDLMKGTTESTKFLQTRKQVISGGDHRCPWMCTSQKIDRQQLFNIYSYTGSGDITTN